MTPVSAPLPLTTAASYRPDSPAPIDANLLQVLPLVMHAVLLGALGVMIWILFVTVKEEKDPDERLMLSVSIAVGLLIVLACAGLGLSIASFVVDSITFVNPFRLATIGVAAPLLAGVLAGRFFTNALNEGNEVALRFVLCIAAILVTVYIDVYMAVLGGIGTQATRQLLPNVLFVVAMGLYMMKNVRRRKPAGNDRG